MTIVGMANNYFVIVILFILILCYISCNKFLTFECYYIGRVHMMNTLVLLNVKY